MTAKTPAVLVGQTPELTTIRLNRPESLNALNVALLTELVAALKAHRDSGSKVLLIEGAGRAFCVGEDLKETLAPRSGSAEELRVAFELLQDVTRLLVSTPGPTIAAVRGFAVGGGAEIALAADFVIVEEGTRLRFPEVPIGHAHTGGITLRLPAMVGLLRAKELLLTGRWVEADECAAIGLATQVADDAGAAGRELAARLAGQPSRSMAAAKRALELSTFPQQESNLQLEVESALYCFAAPEATETFAQFTSTKTVAGAR
jgi:2-(1,2-epoxy-1,2-dihydrophenyl)acetyl-CoA isomerase